MADAVCVCVDGEYIFITFYQIIYAFMVFRQNYSSPKITNHNFLQDVQQCF